MPLLRGGCTHTKTGQFFFRRFFRDAWFPQSAPPFAAAQHTWQHDRTQACFAGSPQPQSRRFAPATARRCLSDGGRGSRRRGAAGAFARMAASFARRRSARPRARSAA